jgi:Toastrack DUF4097
MAIATVALAALAATLASTPVSPADTTFAVHRGMRLEVRNQSGSVAVKTWNRDVVEISSGPSDGAAFEVDGSGSVIRVRPSRGRWRDRGNGRRWEWDDSDDDVDMQVTAPPYLAVHIEGVEIDVTVEGLQSDISVETVEGAIDVVGGNGLIRLSSVDDRVSLRNSGGRIEVSSADGDLLLENIRGEITAEAVDGDVELRRIDSRDVRASSVDGSVTYEGSIHDDGRYHLSTHDGDVVLYVPAATNATVNVATYEGDFETTFPIVLRESRRRRFSFTLGTGRAEISLEAFDGDIYLRRN